MWAEVKEKRGKKDQLIKRLRRIESFFIQQANMSVNKRINKMRNMYKRVKKIVAKLLHE